MNPVMNGLRKGISMLALGGLLLGGSVASALPVRTPEGNMPLVHWAFVESNPGKLPDILAIGGRTLAATAAKEAGTYALYGGIDSSNPDLLCLLEIYESLEAYRIHGSSEAFQQYRAERFPLMKRLTLVDANGIALEQKAEGTGTFVRVHRYEIRPDRLAEYQQLAAAEAVRAVGEDVGVMGIFVTADRDVPNVIRTMEIYRDERAFQSYVESPAYNRFLRGLSSIFLSAHETVFRSPNVELSGKGVSIP